MLFVVLACVAVASVTGAWTGGQFAREQERDNLRRLASTLADAGFPLTENVLRQMAGLSGADFVVLSDTGDVVRSTIALARDETVTLNGLVERSDPFRQGSDETVTLAAKRYLAARLPVRMAATRGMPQSLCVLVPEEHWNRVARRAAWPPILAGFIAAVVAVALTSLLARRFTQPIRQLSEQATAIAAGRFTSTPLPTTDDELRDLTASLNRMSEQLGHYEEQVRRSERLRTLGQLGAGIAHQLRNSATGARLALEFHAADVPSTVDRESLDVALCQLDLMETSLKRFLRLGRGEQVPMQAVSLVRLIDETLPLVEPSCRHAGLVLEWEPPLTEIVLDGDADSLRQLLLNLLVNAVEAATSASGRRGVVRVELSRSAEVRERVAGSDQREGPEVNQTGPSLRADAAAPNTNRVVLRVLDTGPGPAPEFAERLFEPFATSKPDGTGLGLSVAQEIALAHGATLDWRREAEWTCFEVAFP